MAFNKESGRLLLDEEEIRAAAHTGDCSTVVEYVNRGWDVDQELDRVDRFTALHCAALRGHTEVARVLCEAGANVNKQGRLGMTPLHYAAWFGHTQTVKCLVEHNATVDVRNEWGETPLHCAAWFGHTQTVKCLVEHNATVDVRDKSGRTPLHRAAQKGHTVVVQCLIEHSANVNVCDENGDTPLHLSSQMGRAAVVELLVNEGSCDMDAVNKVGRTAYDVCGENRDRFFPVIDDETIETIKNFLKKHMRQRSHAKERLQKGGGSKVRQRAAKVAAKGSSYQSFGAETHETKRSLKKIEECSSGSEVRQGATELATAGSSDHTLETSAAIIDGEAGGVIQWKEIGLKIPPNAIAGHIKVEIVDQQLLVQAVHDITEGKALLHRQRIWVTGANEHATFSEPVEVRVNVRSMLEAASDIRLDSQGFHILREKNGEITDVTQDCNIRMHGEEIVYYCKTFSDLHVVFLYTANLLRFIKNIIKTSYMCKICPYIKGGQHGGIAVSLYCHGVDVRCFGDFTHTCIAETKCLRDNARLHFKARCLGSKTNKEEHICADVELDRKSCESTGIEFGESKHDVKPLVADTVQLEVKELNYHKMLLCKPVKVHVHSAYETEPVSPPTRDISGITDWTTECHLKLLREISEGVTGRDFDRLKAECQRWMTPATLQGITETRELLDQLEKQRVIRSGEYSNLSHVLGLLKLNTLKNVVEDLSREINAVERRGPPDEAVESHSQQLEKDTGRIITPPRDRTTDFGPFGKTVCSVVAILVLCSFLRLIGVL